MSLLHNTQLCHDIRIWVSSVKCQAWLGIYEPLWQGQFLQSLRSSCKFLSLHLQYCFSLMRQSGNVFLDSQGKHACQLSFLLPVQATLTTEEKITLRTRVRVGMCDLLGLEQQWLGQGKFQSSTFCTCFESFGRKLVYCGTVWTL